MTFAELQAEVEDLAGARPALARYEEMILRLLQRPETAPARGALMAAKESMHATRLVVMVAAERVKGAVGP